MSNATLATEKKTAPIYTAIDSKEAPRAHRGTSFLYWTAFTLQYFFGEKYFQKFRAKQERKIEKQSMQFGDKGDMPLPRVHIDDLTPAMFRKLYHNANTPVVIEGLGANWEAVKKWSPDYFRENHGDSIVPVRIKGASDKADKTILEDMPLRDMIDNIVNGGQYYGNNLEDLFNENPELRSDMDLPQVERLTMKAEEIDKKRKKGQGARIPKEGEIISTQVFFSNERGRTGFHCSTGGNIFVQIHGIKKWTFVNPRHSAWMHPMIRRDMMYAQTDIDQEKSHSELDEEGFTLYRYIPRYQVELKPGDALLSPQWWWHAIDNREFSIGVSLRYRLPQFKGNALFATLNLLSPGALRHFMTVFKTGWGADKTATKQIFDPKKPEAKAT